MLKTKPGTEPFDPDHFYYADFGIAVLFLAGAMAAAAGVTYLISLTI